MRRLKFFRKKQGLTQLGVQMRTAIDQSGYSKIERGIRQPTMEQAIVLAELFHTSLDYLAERTDNPNPYPKKE